MTGEALWEEASKLHHRNLDCTMIIQQILVELLHAGPCAREVGDMAMNKTYTGLDPSCPGGVFWECLVGRLWLSE